MKQSEVSLRSVRTAVSCSIGIMLASGTSIIGTFGIFMLPILHDFKWGRAKISGVVMTMSCTTALLAPLLGLLFDRWGVRRILIPGIVLYASAVMLLSRANGSVVQFYLLYFWIGVTATLISIVPYTKIVSTWFNRKRGLVLALVGVGVSIGASLLPQLARLLIARFGWRGAYIGIGLLILAVNLPVQYFFLREAPKGETSGVQVAGRDPTELDGMSGSQIRRSRTYWTLIAIIFLTTFVVGGVLAHLVPMMIDRGISAKTAAGALSIYIVGGIGGRLLMGQLLDRFKSPRVALPFFLLAIGGLLALQTAASVGAFAASGALIGVCSGAEAEFGPFLHSRYFGLRAFAETYGLQFLFLAVANGLGPVVMGAVFDAKHSYNLMITAFAAILAIAASLFLLLGPYVYNKDSDGREANITDESLILPSV